LTDWYSADPTLALDDEVSRKEGSLTGDPGDPDNKWLMEITEGADGSPWPVIAARDFPHIAGSFLSFDLQANLSPNEGSYGFDEFLVSILDLGGSPVFVGLTPDWPGDVLVANFDGLQIDENPTVVPVSAAVLLALLGFGTGGLGLWRGRRHLV